jgi:hypothetical protein
MTVTADDRERLFGEITRLVRIEVEGRPYDVPADLELLRCFQYLGFEIAFENFCWNASCENCATEISLPGKSPERMLTCQVLSEAGVSIAKLPEGIRSKP